MFKIQANDTRLRLLHALVRADQLWVSDLAAAVGLRPQAVSSQLQRLVDRGIVTARRDGNRSGTGFWIRAWCSCSTRPGA